MRRDLLYLIALVVGVALMFQFQYAVLLVAVGPAWLLRRGSLRPLWTAPLAAVVLAVAVPLALELLGADCPVEGMDYLNQCNGLATAAMLFLFGGLIVVQIAVVAAVYALIFRAAGAAWHKYR
ncbi:hypothetical protein OJ998_09985 [Solirubrobacter taibaiensis]|nr:hypothetical protein [Solirubrobacter taibaiensis]